MGRLRARGCGLSPLCGGSQAYRAPAQSRPFRGYTFLARSIPFSCNRGSLFVLTESLPPQFSAIRIKIKIE